MFVKVHKKEINNGNLEGVIHDFNLYDVVDFKYSFGSIDKVGFAVNLAQDAVRVWFKDRYEYHPVYPFYPFKKGDFKRETNCLNAALVELKREGARDYWMIGQAQIPLSFIAT